MSAMRRKARFDNVAILTDNRAVRRIAVLSILFASCKCERPPPVKVEAAPEAAAHALVETVLARDLERPEGIGLDADYVYFRKLLRGSFRVPRKGGAVEEAPMKWDQRHAWWDGSGVEKHSNIDDGDVTFSVGQIAVERIEGKSRKVLARSFRPAIGRKPFAVDDERLYWIEPLASSVLAVPKDGGDVVRLAEAWVPVHYDLVPWKDVLYLINIGGSLASIPKKGGPGLDHGTFSELGNHRNGVWMSADDEGIFIVSDATESRTVDGSMVFGGRVVRADHPRGGMPREDQVPGLVFATNVWFDDANEPEGLARVWEEHLEPLKDGLGAGKWPLVMRVWAESPSVPGVEERRAKVLEWLRAHAGAGARVELDLRPPPVATEKLGHNVQLGISEAHVASVFAP